MYHIVTYSSILFFINCQATEEIQGMTIHLAKIGDKLTLEPLVFRNMCNLWFLEICGSLSDSEKIDVPKSLQLPDTLMVLRWDYFPLESVSPKLMPKNLIELRMHMSSLTQLGHGVKVCALASCVLSFFII